MKNSGSKKAKTFLEAGDVHVGSAPATTAIASTVAGVAAAATVGEVASAVQTTVPEVKAPEIPKEVAS